MGLFRRPWIEASASLAARGVAAPLLCPPPRRHLDLDAHARVDKAGDDSGGGGPDLAEILPEKRGDLCPVLGPRHDVVRTDDIGEARAGLLQGGRDIAEGL